MLQIKVNKQMKCYYIIIYGHVFMCMYVCMCKREKHREIERERESDRDCRVRWGLQIIFAKEIFMD